jgi:hypothetical protein
LDDSSFFRCRSHTKTPLSGFLSPKVSRHHAGKLEGLPASGNLEACISLEISLGSGGAER